MKNLSTLTIFLLLLVSFCGCVNQNTSRTERVEIDGENISQSKENYISIKYRDDPVDIGSENFEFLDTAESSFIRGAWYDETNQYMVINLNGIYYHYCGLPIQIWSSFSVVNSFGKYYNQSIKGDYDCRLNSVPKY